MSILATPDSQPNEAADSVTWGTVNPWPTLDRAALYGLAGEIVLAIEPQTEADPVAMLLTILTAFGNAAGRESRAVVGDDEHPARLFVALAGATSAGGKGTSFSAVSPILRSADEEWFKAARVNGFASGEAMVARLSGHLRREDEAAIEKRAFIIEPEFARLLAVNARDGSTASPILRQAWDEGRLQLVRAKQNLLAEDAHVSLLAHVTPDELRAKMTANDISGGFANRVLFACVKRSRRLPSPRSLDQATIGGFAKRLRAAIDFARTRRILERSPEAEEVWAEFYHAEADRDGIAGEVTARSAAQRLRIAVCYALLDLSPVIRPEHIIAAEAVWRYAASSAEHLFGGLRGDRIQDRLLEALRDAYPAGLDRTQQRDLFARNAPSDRIEVARELLVRQGLVRIERAHTAGRDRFVAFAVPVRPNDGTRPKGVSDLFRRLSSYGRTQRSECLFHVGQPGTSCASCGVAWTSHAGVAS